ncbi:MAG: bestrophin family ion channel [Armatimonas sp.]
MSLAVTAYWHWYDITSIALSPTPFTLLGTAITIFLGFRTNTAYSRWWEARTLWGGIINQSRTIVRQALTFSMPKPGEAELPTPFAQEIAYYQLALVNAMRAHLRQQDPIEEARPYLPASELELLQGERNVPSALLVRMGLCLRRAFQGSEIDTIQLNAMDDTLNDLTNLLGGCERIKNTPIPQQYDTVPQLAIYVYSTLLPLGLIEPMHWWTPVISSLITFFFIAIDSIGSNIEDPFENSMHDVPLSALCRTIEINLRQMLQEKELPPPLQEVDGVLH